MEAGQRVEVDRSHVLGYLIARAHGCINAPSSPSVFAVFCRAVSPVVTETEVSAAKKALNLFDSTTLGSCFSFFSFLSGVLLPSFKGFI